MSLRRCDCRLHWRVTGLGLQPGLGSPPRGQADPKFCPLTTWLVFLGSSPALTLPLVVSIAKTFLSLGISQGWWKARTGDKDKIWPFRCHTSRARSVPTALLKAGSICSRPCFLHSECRSLCCRPHVRVLLWCVPPSECRCGPGRAPSSMSQRTPGSRFRTGPDRWLHEGGVCAPNLASNTAACRRPLALTQAAAAAGSGCGSPGHSRRPKGPAVALLMPPCSSTVRVTSHRRPHPQKSQEMRICSCGRHPSASC